MRRFFVCLAVLCFVFAGVPVVRAQSAERCFSETGFCISGRIQAFWEQNGGLPVFGYPIGAQGPQVIEGNTLQAQWFQRARLELHPDQQAPYDVLMGRVGAERLTQQSRDWFSFPTSQPIRGCQYFSETKHVVCEPFLSYWRANGLRSMNTPGSNNASLAFFGLPLNDATIEANGSGAFVSQWFERARLEFHTENQPPFNLLGGLLGSELLTPIAAPTPAPAPAPTPAAPAAACTALPTGDRHTTTNYYDLSADKFTYRSSVGSNTAGNGATYLTMEVTMLFGPPDESELNRVFTGQDTFFIAGANGQRYKVDKAATAALPRAMTNRMISFTDPITVGQLAFLLPQNVAPASLEYDGKAIAPQYPRAELNLKWPACGGA